MMKRDELNKYVRNWPKPILLLTIAVMIIPFYVAGLLNESLKWTIEFYKVAKYQTVGIWNMEPPKKKETK